MKGVADGAVIKDHHFAKIRFDLSQVLDISPIAQCAVLSVVSAREILPFAFKPVDDRVGVFLDRGSEGDQVIPFTNLRVLAGCSSRKMTRTVPFSGTHRNVAACARSTESGLEGQ
jgi:hypothetical protein